MKRTVASVDMEMSTTSRVAMTVKSSRKSHAPHSNSSSSPRSASAWRVEPANAGDHIAIHHFLQALTHQPSLAEFQAQLEDPLYEPSDRLLIRWGAATVGHVRLLHREMRLGPIVVPVSVLSDFLVAPEYRPLGCEAALLKAAQDAMVRSGAILGVCRTKDPYRLCRHKWAICGRHYRSTANPRRILSHLAATEEEQIRSTWWADPRHPGPTYNIRLWRRVEMAALPRLYAENTTRLWGPLQRSNRYWEWLVNRGGNERIYVAISGPDQFALDDALAPIVGYAATRQGRLIETMCAATHPRTSTQLLARACGDAIESGIDRVEVDAPPDDPLHAILTAAGGDMVCREVESGETLLATVLKPQQLARELGHLFRERIEAAGLPLPCTLGMLIDGVKTRFSVLPRGVQWRSGNLGRSYLECTASDLAPLLLGHLHLRESVTRNQLRASTRVALELAEVLFAPLPLWRPPWDDLPTA